MYDLAVIGGGPGGYVAAERAGAAGLKVVLFERKSLGGVCLNEGCIPTKTLLYSAKVYNYALTGDHYGVYVKEPSFDYSKIVARKNKVVKKLVGGVKLAMKSNNVEVVTAEAMIQGRDAEAHQDHSRRPDLRRKEHPHLHRFRGRRASVPGSEGGRRRYRHQP